MKIKYLYGAALLCAAFLSCGRHSDSENTFTGIADTLTRHASLLDMTRRLDGVTIVRIADPWKDGATLASYALVHRDSVVPEDIPAGMSIVRVPVTKAAVNSAVHTAAMNELGALDALTAVADLQFFPPNDTVAALVDEGKVADLGAAMNPDVETIAAVKIEVVLRSPVQGQSAAKLPTTVTPVECLDYMETTPIGRAEWLLLIGELFGKSDEAAEIFQQVENKYDNLVRMAAAAKSPKPKILVETETSGVWYVAAGDSYAARMYADAGADYPWADTNGNGSLALSLEDVAAKAMDADLWLVRSYGYETTPATLVALNPRYGKFAPVINNNVYSCDTEKRNVFADATFHPELLLADYIAIFHPEVIEGYKPVYFTK